MKRIVLLITICIAIIGGNLNAQSANCFVFINPMDTTICPGDSVFIQATANLLDSNQFFDFNTGTLPTGWSTTGSTFFTAPCGPSPTNTPYYWASTASAGTYPGITTAAFDVTCGGVIIFNMVYSIQGGSTPCEGPDQYNEGVSLQYSLNGGLTWIDIIYYAPNGTTLPANPGVTTPGISGVTPFTSWNTFTVPIPFGALSTSTMFRWTQLSTSGSCCDNWGLENIIINSSGGTCGTETVVNWSTGLTDTLSFWITPTSDTTLWAIVYDTLGIQQCVSDTVQINLFDGNFSFNLPPTANVFCPSASTLVGINSVVGASLPVSYSWTLPPATLPISTGASATLTGQGVTPDQIWYYVDVTDNCGYIQTDSIMLNVNQTLSISNILMNPQMNCLPNGTATAIVQGNQGPITYNWTNASGGQVSATSSVTNAASGWYYISVTDNVCTTSDSIFITQVLIDNITYNLQDTVTTNCPNGTVVANVSSLANASFPVTFNWTTGPNATGTTISTLSFANLQGNGVAPSFIPYYMTFTDACGYTRSDTVILKVTNINNLNFNLPDTLFKYCPGDSALAQITGLTGAQAPTTYLWSNGSTLNNSWLTSTGQSPTENITYSVTATDACGFTKTKSVVLSIEKLLNITSVTSTPASSCNPTGEVVATVAGNTGTAIFQWEDSLNYITAGAGDSIASSSWNNIGSGWYYFTVTDDVCSDLDSIEVSMLNPPIASFTASAIDGCAGVEITFNNTSQNTATYVWDFGNGNTVNVPNTAPQTQQFFTSSVVTLTATTAGPAPCSSTATTNISIVVCGCTDPNAINYDPNAVVQGGTCIYPIPVVEDPNVFTPNGDGQNDLFFFETTYTVEFELTITNRWGNVMYDKTLDLTQPIGNQGWDGKTPGGAEAETGTYFYKYTAKGVNGDEVSGKGFLQLLRD